MKIPTSKNWGNINKQDLDANWAFEQFCGKTFQEAESMFKQSAIYYQEGLQSMPAIPFNFYAPALASYIESNDAEGDSDGASTFLHMISWILKNHHEIISKETKEILLKAAQKVASNQQYYGADIEIYGEFSALYKEIEILFNNCA